MFIVVSVFRCHLLVFYSVFSYCCCFVDFVSKCNRDEPVVRYLRTEKCMNAVLILLLYHEVSQEMLKNSSYHCHQL